MNMEDQGYLVEVLTKKYSPNLKVRELFYLVGMFRTLSPGDSISVARRKLLQGGGRGSKATYMFAAKGAGSLNTKIRYQVKELNILCMGKCKPLGLLNSSAPQLSGADPVSLFT